MVGEEKVSHGNLVDRPVYGVANDGSKGNGNRKIARTSFSCMSRLWGSRCVRKYRKLEPLKLIKGTQGIFKVGASRPIGAVRPGSNPWLEC